MAFYRGFSTKNWKLNKSFKQVDIELVKTDLLNHIFTIPGERVHLPSFGTRIPLLTFEQNTEDVRDIVEEDLQMVFEYDPRVELIDLNVLSLPDNNAIIAIATLFFIEFDVTDSLHITVDGA